MNEEICLPKNDFQLECPVVCRQSPPRIPQMLLAAQQSDEIYDSIEKDFLKPCSEENRETRDALLPQKCVLLQLQILLDRGGSLFELTLLCPI